MPELQLDHPIGDVVRTAIRTARWTLGQTHTASLFAALAEADVYRDWERFWLVCGCPTLVKVRTVRDPADPADNEFVRWQGLLLTPAAARAVDLADLLCAAYNRDVVDPGLVALALLGDRRSGAAMVLMEGSGLTHEDLVDVAQSELVGTQLVDLDTVLERYYAGQTPVERHLPAAPTITAVEDLGAVADAEPSHPSASSALEAADSSEPVALLATPEDREIASTISRWLDDNDDPVLPLDTSGIDNSGVGTAGIRTTSAIVPLASRAAAADPAWHAAIENLECDRLIPVRVDAVPADDLPPVLATRNWVDWSPDDERNRTAILHALRNDVDDFRAAKALQSEAEVWDRAGRPNYLVISSAERIRASQRHLRAAALSPTSEVVSRYLRASEKDLRRQARNRWGRWAYRAIALMVAAALVVVIPTALRSAARSNDTAALAMNALSTIDNRPDRLAMLSAATILQPGYSDDGPARVTLVDTLARPWAAGYLGQDKSVRQIAAVLTADERRAITLNDEGNLTAWDTWTLQVLWRHTAASPQPVGLLDADPTGAKVVIASGTTLHIVDTDSWQQTTTPLPVAPTGLALAPADGYVVVTAGQMLIVDAANGRASPAPIQGEILALRQTADGHALALIRQDEKLVLADPRTGSIVARATRPSHPFERAAIGRDGTVTWTGPDRQLYLGSDGLDLAPTGQAVPDAVEVLQPMSDGRVAFGGAQFGVRIYDHRAHAEVGQICLAPFDGGTEQLVVSPTEDLSGCIDGYGVELWRTRDLSPLASAGPTPIGRSTHATAGVYDVDGSADGGLTLTWHPTPEHPDREQVHTAVDGTAVTAVAAGARWFIAGTGDGHVAQYSFSPDAIVPTGWWTVPGGKPVIAVGPDPNDETAILAETAGGLQWRVSSCLLCATDDAILIGQMKRRLWGCYTESQLEQLNPDIRRLLGVKVCPPMPDPVG